MGKKMMDEFLEKFDEEKEERLILEKKFKPLLDGKLKSLQELDNKIEWFEQKIATLEKMKKKILGDTGNLLESSGQQSHALYNGYTVKPDNKRKVEVKDISKFMKWLKENKKPQVVFDFFEDAMKISSLKKFCETEANEQRLNGEIEPIIDGVDFGEVTYTKLKTEMKKEKKK